MSEGRYLGFLIIIKNKIITFIILVSLSIWFYIPSSTFKVYGDKEILKDIEIKIDGACDEEPMKTIFKNGKLTLFELKDCTLRYTYYVIYKNKYFGKDEKDHTLFWTWDYINRIYIYKEKDGIYFHHFKRRSFIDRYGYRNIKLSLDEK